MATESEFDTTLKIRSLEKQVEYYKIVAIQEKIWRRLCFFMAFVIVSRSIYDLWAQYGN